MRNNIVKIPGMNSEAIAIIFGSRKNGQTRNWSVKIKAVFVLILLVVFLVSCFASFGNTRIAKPDEYQRVFEASEAVILKSLALVIREKKIGVNVQIDKKNNRVTTDYLILDDWRTKSIAQVKRLSWRECEVSLAVITEKRTEQGWELRRLLEKPQFDNIFYDLDLKIYEEMAKIQ